MRPEFTPTGVSVRTFDEIYAELVRLMGEVYGHDINVAQDTPDGQVLGIFAKQILDLETFGLNLYGEFDPDFARGEMLNKIIKLAGISRRPATQSVVDVTITTDRSLTLSAGYTVQDDLEQRWVLEDDTSLVVGANTVTLVSEEYAAISADANSITDPITIVIGVLSVTNPTAATVGTDEETDEQLRRRRNKSLENAAYSTVGGLVAKLGEISNVTNANVVENDTDVTDIYGIPAHGIWCIVEGGTTTDIAEVMAKNKTAGTAMKGSISENYIETILLATGDTFTKVHTMLFDRPTEIDLHVQMTVTRKEPLVSIDIELIKSKLAERTFFLNENVQANQLYSTVYEAGNTFIVTDLQISDDGVTFTDELLETQPDQRFTIDVANVSITEV
jgi:uncharacterized phage protein gp47/JayE